MYKQIEFNFIAPCQKMMFSWRGWSGSNIRLISSLGWRRRQGLRQPKISRVDSRSCFQHRTRRILCFILKICRSFSCCHETFSLKPLRKYGFMNYKTFFIWYKRWKSTSFCLHSRQIDYHLKDYPLLKIGCSVIAFAGLVPYLNNPWGPWNASIFVGRVESGCERAL